MSRRLGFVVRVDHESDGGVSPNAYVPFVTVEVRVFYPPRATRDELDSALQDAFQQAETNLGVRFPYASVKEYLRHNTRHRRGRT